MEPAGRTFYMYITEKSGVFNAMLRYDKFHSDKMQDAAKRFFYMTFSSQKVSRENCDNLIRSYRAFCEIYVLLVNNKTFGQPPSTEDGFEVSFQIFKAGTKAFERKKWRLNKKSIIHL